MKRRSVFIPVALGLGAVAVVPAGYRWLRHWGSSLYEQELRLPGDELSEHASVVHTRAVSVDAPAAAVWPWLMQIGQDRSGFFSYTCLENLMRCDMPKVHEVRQEWQHRAPADKVLMAPPRRYGGKAYNEVATVDPLRSLVLVAPGDRGRLDSGDDANWVWQFFLQPEGGGTRLIVRSRYRRPQLLLEPVHFMMEQRMMLTIKGLSEQNTGGPSAMATIPRTSAA